MKAIILDGSREGDTTGERAGQALLADLALSGWQVEHVLLREKKIGNCAGDFFCWMRSPGICHVADDNRGIAEVTMKSDLMIYLTPITFGGYSSHLKSMVDHLIQNISPFFTKVKGETHHEWRYKKYPDFLVVGYLDQPHSRSEQIFRHLTWRNSINLCADSAEAVVLYGTHSDAEMATITRQGLLSISAGGHTLKGGSLPACMSSVQDNGMVAGVSALPATAAKERRAVLIVGSPRTKTSSSLALGQFLLEELEQKGFISETYFTHTSLRSPERMRAIFDAVDCADIVVFAFPLYVDSIPAPAIEVLERIAAHRNSGYRGNARIDTLSVNAGGARFVAIANCGFPESEHNATALAICEQFALQAGFIPVGSLALGGGEGLVRGRKMREVRGPLQRVKNALAVAGDALSRNQVVPESAIALLARPFIPAWIYRLVGGLGWKSQAKKYGMQKELRRQPYAKS